MVNNRLVCFNEVFEMIMNSTMNIILPPNFVKPTPKTPPTSTSATSAECKGKKKGGKKRKAGENKGGRIAKNVAPIPEFLMKDGKTWKGTLCWKVLEGSSQMGRLYLHVCPLAHP